MSKPRRVIINNTEYLINTDYRVALKCDDVARDETIGDYERGMAIVYLLFGDKGIESNNLNELMEAGFKYMSRSKGNGESKEPDMDYTQDWSYIKASFMSDYGIAIDDIDMHYYDFVDYLSGLTETSVLSRVRYIRNYDTSDLKGKALTDMNEAKRSVALRKKEVKLTEEQITSADRFEELIGG